MKKFATLALVALSATTLAACESTYNARLEEAMATAERAEAKADAALKATGMTEERANRMFDASQRK